ncbi:M6 family metalloprotease domain-containing protein [Marinilabilia rubra]|uniref:Peptidase M6 n=1 Tax=Marinilabilia rubra TaxID=2162893 RepID=A0A2U2B7S8_9BACT|nr:M6 family metalloprotease domain-containing protein [Marinilabilia rubra]PWD99117.1 peptidase M6 [Marinilabilia rubra]
MGLSDRNMKFFFIILFGVFLFISSIQNTYAVGAYPYPQEVKQPDGSSLTIKIHGDEWYNWITTTDGYRILKTENGFFEYASLLKSGEVVNSGIRASNPDKRETSETNFLNSISQNIGVSRDAFNKKRDEKYGSFLKSSTMSTFYPSSGENNLLLILANFSDTDTTYSSNKFDDFMNQADYDGTGSFRDYYQEVSKGALTINTTVSEWVEVPGNHDYYGSEEKWGEFALQAVQQAAASGIDFSQFDNDGDGVVEGIAIIHQGAGQEVTSDETDIWSHSYSFSSWGVSESERTFNGVVVDQYTIQPEWRSTSGDINTIGVICHEFGHNLGLLDFYDTNEETDGQYPGTGVWDIMASGTYNGSPSGSTPAHHNPFSKAELGWVDVTVIDEPAGITLNPVYNSGEVLRINSPVANEYILLENRQKTGFDAYLPGGGMLVYHVDGNLIEERRQSNTINVDSHQAFYPIAANGTIGNASCPFPGSANVTALTDDTSPAMETWDGQGFNRSMTAIGKTDDVITFDFMSIQDGSPIDFDAIAADDQNIDLSWTPATENYPVLVAWSSDGTFGAPVDGQTYSVGETISGGGTVLYYGDSQTAETHTNLNSLTNYHYSIWSNKGDIYSANLKDSAQTKPAAVSSFPWTDGFESELINWSQEFRSGDTQWGTGPVKVNNIEVAPYEGTLYASFFQEGYTSPATRLISPPLNLESTESYQLKFRHIQSEWEGDQDEMRVLVRTQSSGVWEEIAYYGAHTPEWAERIIDIPYSESLEIAFEGTSNYGYGIGIDEVTVYNTSPCQVKPDISVSNISSSDSTKTTINLTWDRGNGDALLVLARKDSAIYEIPDDGISYTANSNFGSGEKLGNNTYVIYNGTGNDISLSGLEHTSDYYFAFYEYYSSDHCYQTDAVTELFETEPNIYDITVSVTDPENAAIENAMVVYNDKDTLYTDGSGQTLFQAIHNELYQHIDVFKNEYTAKSYRFITDASKTLSIALKPFDPIAPSNLSYTKDYQTIDLKWDPVINDNFDHYHSFHTSIDGWQFIDNDQSETYGIGGVTFQNEGNPMAFMVFDAFSEEVLQTGYDMAPWSGDKVLAAFAAAEPLTPNNDWIISPEFTVKEGDFFSFMGKTLYEGSGEGAWGKEIINIKVKPSGQTTWTTLLQEEPVPTSWSRFESDLSSYVGQKIQVAIQSVGNDTFVLLLDDLRVGPELGALSMEPTFPAPNTTFSKAERHKENISKPRKNPRKTQSTASSAPSMYVGNVEYAIYKDGSEISRTFGFGNALYTDIVSDCSLYDYTVSAIYGDVNMESATATTIQIQPCYSVTFIIKDEFGNPIQNASITFNNETMITDANGETRFSGVSSGAGQSYTITMTDYDQYEDVVDVNSDTSVQIAMTVSNTAISEEWKEQLKFNPNPVNTNGTITGLPHGTFEIELYDITGKMIERRTIFGGQDIIWPFSVHKPGLYMMLIKNEDGQAHRLKIIKKH